MKFIISVTIVTGNKIHCNADTATTAFGYAAEKERVETRHVWGNVCVCARARSFVFCHLPAG
jgi:hypothetical protein